MAGDLFCRGAQGEQKRSAAIFPNSFILTLKIAAKHLHSQPSNPRMTNAACFHEVRSLEVSLLHKVFLWCCPMCFNKGKQDCSGAAPQACSCRQARELRGPAWRPRKVRVIDVRIEAAKEAGRRIEMRDESSLAGELSAAWGLAASHCRQCGYSLGTCMS